MLEKQMRLEDLLGREVTIRWFEGVALIQAVCRQLLGARWRDSDVFPNGSRKSCSRRTGPSPASTASGRTAVRDGRPAPGANAE